MDQETRNKLAFLALGGSCLVGAYLIGRLERRVQRLDDAMTFVCGFLETQFQAEVDEKFEDIVERLDDD